MVKIIVGIVHNDIQEVCRSCRIVTALGGCAGAQTVDTRLFCSSSPKEPGYEARAQ